MSTAERFVVRLHLFGVGDLERRDDALVRGVRHGRFAVPTTFRWVTSPYTRWALNALWGMSRNNNALSAVLLF
jgi:hypothetical protein